MFNFDLTKKDIAPPDESEHIKSENIVEPIKQKFMARFKRFEPMVKDSTAIKLLKTCPRLYFYQIVLGRVPNNKSNIFVWGSAYHLFREVLEREYGYNVNTPTKFDEEKARQAYVTASTEGFNYWQKNCILVPAKDDKDEFRNPERLLRSFMKAFDHWKREKIQGNVIVLEIEQAFHVQLKDGSSIGGRMDQLIKIVRLDEVWGRDFKTTTKDTEFYSRQLEPNDQFTRYTLAETKLSGEQVKGQMVELLFNANVPKKPRKSVESYGPLIITLETSRNKWQLDQFENEQVIVNKQLDMYREEDVWPMHENSCPWCPFHSVCTKGSEAGMMAQLESHFSVRPWNFANPNGGENE